MKFLSVILLIVILHLSWNYFTSEPLVSEHTHINIQKDLKRIIVSEIQKRIPSADRVTFKKFWSEAISEKVIRAGFIYTFDSDDELIGKNQIEIDGHAILEKEASSESVESWVFKEINIHNESIHFREPITISPGDN